MSVSNSKSPKSIFESQDSNDLKERQRLEELKRQAKVQQVKLDKRLNKQKILMGAFLGQVLASDGPDEKIIQKYFTTHFPEFLTRKSDKELFKSMIESLGGDIRLDNEAPFVGNNKVIERVVSSEVVNSRQQDSLLDENSYSTYKNN